RDRLWIRHVCLFSPDAPLLHYGHDHDRLQLHDRFRLRPGARAAVRGGKGGKRKGSSLQQGFQKPAQAVNRDVVIGETITVG
ncbi:hypothetical protein, partial [Salmonella enterica]|uniref:hypothetical protein n=1 Tax=Salmonella enterica TaxID=28901 RepID=UPI00111CCB1F